MVRLALSYSSGESSVFSSSPRACQAGILVAAGDRVGEDREGDRPEAGEAGKRLPLLGRGGPLLLLDALEGADGGEDVAGFRFFAAGNDGRCVWRAVFRTGGGRIGRARCFGGRGHDGDQRWDVLGCRWKELARGWVNGRPVKQRRLVPSGLDAGLVWPQLIAIAPAKERGSPRFGRDRESKKPPTAVGAVSRDWRTIFVRLLCSRLILSGCCFDRSARTIALRHGSSPDSGGNSSRPCRCRCGCGALVSCEDGSDVSRSPFAAGCWTSVLSPSSTRLSIATVACMFAANSDGSGAAASGPPSGRSLPLWDDCSRSDPVIVL